MAKFKFTEVLLDGIHQTARVADDSSNMLTEKDVGKFLKLKGDSQYGLCAKSNPIEAVLVQTNTPTGTFDGYTFDETTAWIRGLPENAGAESEPVYALEILSSRSGVTLTTWPNRPASIRITGTFGWAAVPQVIKDLVIHRTIELRDALKAGSTGELATFDGGIPMRSNTTWLLKEVNASTGGRFRCSDGRDMADCAGGNHAASRRAYV